MFSTRIIGQLVASMAVGDKVVYTENEVDSLGMFAELHLDKPFVT